MHLKMSSVKWRLFCLGLNVLKNQYIFFKNKKIFSDVVPYKYNIKLAQYN